MTIKNGDMPAMPQNIDTSADGDFTVTSSEQEWSGLTKREHFAGLAMAAWIQHHGSKNDYGFCNVQMARAATEAADALLEDLSL